jgi:hypothetical protein
MPVAGDGPVPAVSREEVRSVSVLAKRALLGALTLVGLVLLGVGAWFSVHLGPSGSATFTTEPAQGAVVVVEPSVLNRVDRPVTVTARAPGSGQVWIGRASASDADAVVGGWDAADLTGVHVRDWSLVAARSGAGRATGLAASDVWRQSATGTGTVRLRVTQDRAPESLVVAAPDGSPAALDSVSVTAENRSWFFQALLLALVGLLSVVAGLAGLWHLRRGARPAAAVQDPSDHPRTEEVAA